MPGRAKVSAAEPLRVGGEGRLLAPTTLLAQAPTERFISTPERPEIYRDGWIDKTAQMATLYGFRGR